MKNQYIEVFTNGMNEYVSGKIADAVFKALKDQGFDCESDPEEIEEFVRKTSRLLRNIDIEEVVPEFFQDNNCTRHILQKMFGGKRK